jgi:hypothetical protein
MQTTFDRSIDYRALYNSLSQDARDALDERAKCLKLADDALANLKRLENGEDIVVHQGSIIVGFEYVERALSEALAEAQKPSRPDGSHKPHERGRPNRYWRATEMAKFLVQQARNDLSTLGEPLAEAPKGSFKRAMIHRGSLADGADFEMLANKANPSELYIRMTIPSFVSAPEVRHYGPFDASILPWE